MVAAPPEGASSSLGLIVPPASPPHVPSRLERWNASLPSPMSRLTVTYFLAGALARCTSSIIISPLDCLKVRAQFSQKAGGVARDALYTGTLDAARSMWQKEGVVAFYRGLPARLAYVAPAAAISFVFYEQFRALYHQPTEAEGGKAKSGWVAVPLVMGGLARMFGSAVRTPFDLVRQRMQVQGSLEDRATQMEKPLAQRRQGIYRNSGEALLSTVRATRSQGLTSMWTGLGASILRDIPFAMIYFFTYESSKTFQVRHFPPPPAVIADRQADQSDTSKLEKRASGLSAPRYMLSGGFAAACAVMATMPLDVIKTRLQTQVGLTQPRYRGIAHAFRTILREEGVRGLFKGAVPRLCYLVPASALTFALYEAYKRQLQGWMELEETQLN